MVKVSVDANYQLLAARYLRRQLKQLTAQLDGMREAEDVEFVHHARVASRRLRAALKMFGECFARKKVKCWRKEIGRLTKDLGDARDKDVQIAFVCDVLSRLQETEYFPGLARLLVKLEHRREEVQPRVVKTVDRFLRSPAPGDMREDVKSLVKQLGKRGVPIKSEFVQRQAEKHILTRLDEMLGYQSCLGDAEDQDGHHAMRIAAKRLRYTMEICKPIYDGGFDEFITTVKEVQTLLGDIHDCDVWAEDLQNLLEEERQRIVKYYQHSGPMARLQAGIDYLRQERHEQRERLFDKLVQYWQEVERMGLWNDLGDTVRRRDRGPSASKTADGRQLAHPVPRRAAMVRRSPNGHNGHGEPQHPEPQPAPRVRAGAPPAKST